MGRPVLRSCYGRGRGPLNKMHPIETGHPKERSTVRVFRIPRRASEAPALNGRSGGWYYRHWFCRDWRGGAHENRAAGGVHRAFLRPRLQGNGRAAQPLSVVVFGAHGQAGARGRLCAGHAMAEPRPHPAGQPVPQVRPQDHEAVCRGAAELRQPQKRCPAAHPGVVHGHVAARARLLLCPVGRVRQRASRGRVRVRGVHQKGRQRAGAGPRGGRHSVCGAKARRLAGRLGA